MFSVEATGILPFPPDAVFALARDLETVPRWCGAIHAGQGREWRVAVAGVSTVLQPATVAIDPEQRCVVHQASGDGLTIRWELSVGEHRDGASFGVRTSIDLADAHPHRTAICRMTSREATDDLARIALLLDAVVPEEPE